MIVKIKIKRDVQQATILFIILDDSQQVFLKICTFVHHLITVYSAALHSDTDSYNTL
jgi:hypothetical protein